MPPSRKTAKKALARYQAMRDFGKTAEPKIPAKQQAQVEERPRAQLGDPDLQGMDQGDAHGPTLRRAMVLRKRRRTCVRAGGVSGWLQTLTRNAGETNKWHSRSPHFPGFASST